MSTVETMTIHRALAELKVLGPRIEKEIYNAKFCASAKNSSKKVNGIDIPTYKKEAQGSHDKIETLTRRLMAIKEAISKSNAETYQKVCDVEYTIAEIIYMNQEGMEYFRKLLSQMQQQYSNAVRTIEQQNASLNDRADNFLKGLNNKDKDGFTPEGQLKMREGYIEDETMVLVDGLDGIKQKIDDLAAFIDKFTAEADAALSTSNATTVITISY